MGLNKVDCGANGSDKLSHFRYTSLIPNLTAQELFISLLVSSLTQDKPLWWLHRNTGWGSCAELDTYVQASLCVLGV